MYTNFEECVKKKKEEFNCYLSPSPLSCHGQGSWLLPRQGQATTAVVETDNDSGLDSPQEDHHAENDVVTTSIDDNHSDEMQEVRLNMRAGSCKNVTIVRPSILCKVTKE